MKGLASAISATEANISVEGPGEVLADVADVADVAEVLADIEEVVRATELRFSLIRGVGAVEGVLSVGFLGFGVGFKRGILN
jgi:hypothetical protein